MDVPAEVDCVTKTKLSFTQYFHNPMTGKRITIFRTKLSSRMTINSKRMINHPLAIVKPHDYPLFKTRTRLARSHQTENSSRPKSMKPKIFAFSIRKIISPPHHTPLSTTIINYSIACSRDPLPELPGHYHRFRGLSPPDSGSSLHCCLSLDSIGEFCSIHTKQSRSRISGS